MRFQKALFGFIGYCCKKLMLIWACDWQRPCRRPASRRPPCPPRGRTPPGQAPTASRRPPPLRSGHGFWCRRRRPHPPDSWSGTHASSGPPSTVSSSGSASTFLRFSAASTCAPATPPAAVDALLLLLRLSLGVNRMYASNGFRC
uniref:Uncharacterized protein n=1 Tax=Oryza rufipogon TaxID=4529 RepID=A0A0E0Q1Q5_ORYRU